MRKDENQVQGPEEAKECKGEEEVQEAGGEKVQVSEPLRAAVKAMCFHKNRYNDCCIYPECDKCGKFHGRFGIGRACISAFLDSAENEEGYLTLDELGWQKDLKHLAGEKK